jgi:hypothetical protein
VASFLVPVLTGVVLLYNVLAHLQIAILQPAAVLVIVTTLTIAAAAGALAAFGPTLLRIGVLTVSALAVVDATAHLPAVFERLTPEVRGRAQRDQQRVADLARIHQALGAYVRAMGALPHPVEYGEAAGRPDFWMDQWDVSGDDGNADGAPFLGFLAESGVLPVVPVDPLHVSAGKDPTAGRQYVYFLVSPDQSYGGGACDNRGTRWVYLVAATELESEIARPPRSFEGSGCECLWRDQPDFFERYFDYVLCGTYEATSADHARRAARHAEAVAERGRALEAATAAERERTHGAEDQRRVDDVATIRAALDRYIATVGPLPLPVDYGEGTGARDFFQDSWDLSAVDGDGDGRPFLDFLVERRILETVPVDPDNEATGADPRGGRQYVYFVAPPHYRFEGGSCVAAYGTWVYLLGVTDLESEVMRPPARVSGSGCECLWESSPDFFQAHFDYVTCGTFTR